MLLTGCASFGAGRIKLPSGASVKAVENAGKPATIATNEAGVSIPLPEGSRIVVTKEGPLPATEKAPAQPSREFTEILPSGPTTYTQKESSVDASTGVVDTSLAKHKIDVEDRAKLLWVAIACGIAGVAIRSLMPAWPAWSNGAFAAAGLAFLAWKFAEVSPWAWLAVLVGVGLLVLGYKRAEWDANKDGIPDILQK